MVVERMKKNHTLFWAFSRSGWDIMGGGEEKQVSMKKNLGSP